MRWGYLRENEVSDIFAKIGQTQFPVDPPTEDITSLAKYLDPLQDELINFLVSEIRKELDPIFLKAISNTSLYNAQSIIETVLPIAISPQVLNTYNASFPIFSLSRASEATYAEYSLAQSKLTQNWDLTYILGALDLDAERKLSSILSAISKVTKLSLKRNAYNKFENILSITPTTSRVGRAAFSDTPNSPNLLVLEMNIITEELTEDTDCYPDLYDVDWEIYEENLDGETRYL